MNYRISEAAVQDLEKIWIYSYENWSIDQADRYINFIVDEFDYLSENPYSGNDYGHIRHGYFRAKVKSHFIFCRVGSQNNQVEIIRVLHQMMDIENHLNG